MNESLRRALIRAQLREEDVAARLEVDPKTVRRWLAGRVPYPGNRAALAALVRVEEADLWPEAAGPLADRTRPEELIRVFPHRWAIPRDTWARFFSSAQQEIGILAYSALFLAEDAGLLAILTGKARTGIPVRIALGDPEQPAGSRPRHRGRHRRCHVSEGPERSGAVPAAHCCPGSGTAATPGHPVQLDLPSRRPAACQPAHLRNAGRSCARVSHHADTRRRDGGGVPHQPGTCVGDRTASSRDMPGAASRLT